MSSSKVPQETELKLLLLQENDDALRRHPVFAAVAPKKRRQITTYFDAPDYPLGRSGISLRVRLSGDTKVQTLKRTNHEASFGQRDEWECPVAGDYPDLRLFEGQDLDPALQERLSGRMDPIFIIDVIRTAWQLELEGTTQVEAVLDEGDVQANGTNERIREIELELKSGPIAPMFRLALDLASKTPLCLGAESKADRGYRLLEAENRRAVRWRNRELKRGVTVEAGFRQIIASGLTRLVANMPAAATGAAEGIHQMRIALRRLRSSLVLFKPCLDPLITARFNDVLCGLGAILGTARDWDVFAGETLRRAEQSGIGSDVVSVSAKTQREHAHQAVRAMLAAPALTELVIGLAGWSEDSPCARSGQAEDHLSLLAPHLLDTLTRRAVKQARHIENLKPEALHSLRKSMKKIRYGIDALSGLYKQKHVEAYDDHLKKLQDTLGLINDAAVTPRMIEQCAAIADPVQRAASRALLEWNDERHQKALRHLSHHWLKYQKADPFWH